MSYLKSPVNYTGCKYKLLSKIIPLFPNDINIFLDVFGGSGTVCLNTNANFKIYNELNTFLYEIIEDFSILESDYIINHINSRVEKYNLEKGYSKKDLTDEEKQKNSQIKENYIKFRDFLNNESNTKSLDLLTIHYFAFNNLIRHTKRKPIKFNTPSGLGSKCYSSKQHNELIINACNKFKDIEILNKDFRDIDYSILKENDFVYFDPPYLLSNAEYNKNWTKKEELDLYNICESLTKRNVKWAMSNMLVNNNQPHIQLKEWCEKNNYKIHYLDSKYTGWIQRKKNSYNTTQEVLITNY